MGVLTYILGRSGTGKSYSMRNFSNKEIGIVNVQGKILPFKGKYDVHNTDDSSTIVETIEKLAKTYKVIVVDDFQYVMANEFMRRATERGYDKFTEIARHAWDIANCVQKLPQDVIVYVMCHTDTDADGFEKLKTIGKLLDEKIVLEGMSTIVLKTAVSDGQYMFLTQNNGQDTVKSPAGMFPTYAINNDLKYVDEKIRSYYEMDGAKSESDMNAADEAAKIEGVTKPQKKERRERGRSKETSQTPVEKAETETTADAGKPKRNRRNAGGDDGASTGSGETVEPSSSNTRTRSRRREITEESELPFSDINTEELKRKERTVTQEVMEDMEEAINPPQNVETPENPAPTRRRRRA